MNFPTFLLAPRFRLQTDQNTNMKRTCPCKSKSAIILTTYTINNVDLCGFMLS